MTLVLTNARVLDGTGRVLERATIVIDGDRIAEVGGGADVVARPGLEVVDVAGKTVMPALVDVHVHLSAYETLPSPKRGEEPRAPELRYFELARTGRALVEAGVLTVRDVGSFDDHALHLRQAVNLGLAAGPASSPAPGS